MQAGLIVARVRATLLDPNGVYWPDGELYDYLSAAQTAVVSLRPDAYAKTAFVTLAAGALQQVPAGGVQLLDVTRNANGTGIREIDREELAHAVPGWAAAANQAPTILHFMPDARNPLSFHVYPPSDGTSNVELVYAAAPPRVAQATDSLSLPDVYETALHAYTCALAYAKNTDRGDTAKYQSLMQQFVQLVAAKSQGQLGEAPPPMKAMP